MSKAGSKIIKGLKEAHRYARGELPAQVHMWFEVRNARELARAIFINLRSRERSALINELVKLIAEADNAKEKRAHGRKS